MIADSDKEVGKIESIAWHWYDFTCPFCYVSKSRNKILEQNGYNLLQLPFQVHSEVPSEGVYMGERSGPMYDMLEKEAMEANLPLNWPSLLPNSGYALALAEQVRRHIPGIFADVKTKLYELHFVLNEDLGSKEIVNNCLKEFGVKEKEIRRWLEGGVAFENLRLSEKSARSIGINGTPAWMVDNQLILGLQSRYYFQKLSKQF